MSFCPQAFSIDLGIASTIRKMASAYPDQVENDDLYQVLELTPDATAEDIRLSFERLSQAYERDSENNQRSANELKRITAAYELLSDDTRRANYDRARCAALALMRPEHLDPIELLQRQLVQIFEPRSYLNSFDPFSPGGVLDRSMSRCNESFESFESFSTLGSDDDHYVEAHQRVFNQLTGPDGVAVERIHRRIGDRQIDEWRQRAVVDGKEVETIETMENGDLVTTVLEDGRVVSVTTSKPEQHMQSTIEQDESDYQGL